MSSSRLLIASAFGRGETLAWALRESGFQVQILDFTNAFAPEYQRGVGPFPVVNETFHPAQADYLATLEPLTQGLVFWLKEGPVELTGPLSATHLRQYPEIRAWKSLLANEKVTEDISRFGVVWLTRFLQQWISPYFLESWEASTDPMFPAHLPLGLIPDAKESAAQSFARAESLGVDVLNAQSFADSRLAGGRILQIEVEVSRRTVFSADHWIWCLSSAETEFLGAELASKMFWRGIRKPEWVWLSFSVQMQKGPWCLGLPPYSVVIGDVFLPWLYANTFILRRVDETRSRVWLRVPSARVQEIDTRRKWAHEVQVLLNRRLSLADWKVDSGAWSLCPHSEIYSSDQRDRAQVSWKNWDWISPETLTRLDVAERLQREASVFRRLTQWQSDQNKRKARGASDDQSLHAP